MIRAAAPLMDVWFDYSDGSSSKAMTGLGGTSLATRAREAFADCQADETYPVGAFVVLAGSSGETHRWTLDEIDTGS